MKAIDTLIELMQENLDGFTRHDIDSDSYNRGFAYCLAEYLDKAKDLAAEEAANEAKPKEDKGLVGELREWWRAHHNWGFTIAGRDTWIKDGFLLASERFEEILSRYTADDNPYPDTVLVDKPPTDKPKEESLAELADRKGCEILQFGRMTENLFMQSIRKKDGNDIVIEGCSPLCTKTKARLWLEKQGEK